MGQKIGDRPRFYDRGLSPVSAVDIEILRINVFLEYSPKQQSHR